MRPKISSIKLMLAPSMIFLILIFLAPTGFLVFTSFETYKPPGLIEPKFTLQNYIDFFKDPMSYMVIRNSLYIGFMTTLLDFLLGFPVAYYITKARRYRGLMMALAISPILNLSVIRALSWLHILSKRGLVNFILTQLGVIHEPISLLYNHAAVTLGMTHVFLPFMILPLMASLEGIPSSVNEAAMNLGAGPIRRFIYITLPLCIPGFIAGSIFVFIGTIMSYVTPVVLGGYQTKMLAHHILTYFSWILNWPYGATIGTFILMICVIGLTLYTKGLERFTWRPAARR